MGRYEGRYPSDLLHHEWEAIKHFLPAQKMRGRPRMINIEQVINAVLYISHSGCAWRFLPKEFPPWQTVYDYFRQWIELGVWRKIHQVIARKIRLRAKKAAHPRLVIIDGQSVKASYGEERGYDGFKRIRGRKRQILVDSLGLLVAAKVHRANQAETTRAHEVLLDYPKNLSKPEKILGDFAYGRAPFTKWVEENWGNIVECRKGTKEIYRNKEYKPRYRVKHSNLKPKRWIVERTFAWFNYQRRLARDYERKTIISETFLYIAQIPMMLRRLFE